MSGSFIFSVSVLEFACRCGEKNDRCSDCKTQIWELMSLKRSTSYHNSDYARDVDLLSFSDDDVPRGNAATNASNRGGWNDAVSWIVFLSSELFGKEVSLGDASSLASPHWTRTRDVKATVAAALRAVLASQAQCPELSADHIVRQSVVGRNGGRAASRSTARVPSRFRRLSP